MNLNTDKEEVMPLLQPANPNKEDISSKKEGKSWGREGKIVVLMIIVIGSGALNRVFSKITTQPMQNYAFFLTIFNDLAYVICYGTILAIRWAMGIVTKESLAYPFNKEPMPPDSCKGGVRQIWDNMWALKYFVIIGLMEGLANILNTICNVYVSGIMGSLATQLVIVFAMPVAIIMLNARYTVTQVVGAVIVLIGSLIAIVPVTFRETNNGPIGYIVLMASIGLPNSISFTIKELIFKKNKDLDIFVVNTAGSIFQLFFWPALIFVAIALDQTHGLPLSTYIEYGFLCFTGKNPPSSMRHQCGPMPYPYIAYIVNNLIFNISFLVLIRKASTLQAFMATNIVLPLGFFLFLFRWPIIGASKLNIEDVVSLFVILAGIVLFRWASIRKSKEISNEESKSKV